MLVSLMTSSVIGSRRFSSIRRILNLGEVPFFWNRKLLRNLSKVRQFFGTICIQVVEVTKGPDMLLVQS